MDEQPIPYPPGLERINPHTLEDYISARSIQFARVFVNRCGLNITQQEFEELVRQSLSLIPVPQMAPGSAGHLQLVFRHDCLSLGCLDPQCSLCENNPNRRCDVNFDRKYLVNDILKAKCRANIRVEVVDRVTGVLREDTFLQGVILEITVLDGNSYDSKCLEAGQELDEDLDGCCLALNNKGQPLLQAGSGGTNTEDHRVHVPLMGGKALLPDIYVTDSSEALLSGRKPPFRLLVRALGADGKRLSSRVHIHHAVSEAFVLATRRTRTAGKVEVPNVEDHVSKLEHMGKETVKKLANLKAAAEVAGVELNLQAENLPQSINKVGEFRKLALMAEADGHLRQKLQQVLKLSKEKWDEGRDHALRAVVADNYLRVWYADDTMDVGVLFPCRNGEIDLERPVGLLQKKKDSLPGGDPQYEVILLHQQTPHQRQQVKSLQRAAVQNWWRTGHIGWAIFPVESEQLTSTDVQGQTLNVEQDFNVQDGSDAGPPAGYSSPFEHIPDLGEYSRQQQQLAGMQPAVSPFATVAQQPFDQPVSLSSNSAVMASVTGAGLQVTSTQNISKINSYKVGQPLDHDVPPSQHRAPSMAPQMTSMGPGPSGGSGQGLFNFVPSGDFANATNNIMGGAQDPNTGLPFGHFNSGGSYGSQPQGQAEPARQMSLKWDQLRGMDSLDFTGTGIDLSKLESMELPAELGALAGSGGSQELLHGLSQFLGGQPQVDLQGAVNLGRQNSGLESMQSIEHALPSVTQGQQLQAANYQDVLEAAARDFRAQQSGQNTSG